MNLKIAFSPEALNDLEATKEYLLTEFGAKTATDNIKKVIRSDSFVWLTKAV